MEIQSDLMKHQHACHTTLGIITIICHFATSFLIKISLNWNLHFLKVSVLRKHLNSIVHFNMVFYIFLDVNYDFVTQKIIMQNANPKHHQTENNPIIPIIPTVNTIRNTTFDSNS